MLSAQDLYTHRNAFRSHRHHHHLKETSLIASEQTSTALFNIAWMQQLIPYLSWEEHPLGERLYNIQACVRVNDLDEVGDDSHFTSFFMMGNRSLWDYFKKEAVQRSWQFLTQDLGLDPRKLAVTVYQGDESVQADDETAKYRAEQGVASHKISYLDAADNRRSPWPVGPCGPCSEIYYWIGENEFPSEQDNVAHNEEDWLEIRNNVFMEYYRDQQGNLSKLDKQNVDTGMGFERILKVIQHTPSPYETELFAPLIKILEQDLDIDYAAHMQSCRIILDHLRTSSFLIAEWLTPSNEARWYVLRKLLRAMHFERRNIHTPREGFEAMQVSYNKLIAELQNIYGTLFPLITKLSTETITQTILKELQQFDKTLHHGKKILLSYLDELSDGEKLSGEKIFKLYDTFWFPLELTQHISKQHGIIIDEDAFHHLFEEARQQSRADTASNHQGNIDRSLHTLGLQKTEFLGYDEHSSQSKILKKIENNDHQVWIFDTTPFYASRWGQIHDIWTLVEDWITYQVFDVQDYNGIYLHFVTKQ